MGRVFADTSFFLSLLNRDDADHGAAIGYANTVGDRLVTTEWVLVELAAGMSAPTNRVIAAQFIQDLRSRPAVTIVPAESGGFADGLALYADRADKGWSLTDCISFIVMKQHGLTEALTGDHHFEQAGFVALLKRGA